MAESRPVEEATDAGLAEDYSCGYCLQRWVYLIDPRELPCSHVFCLPCLQNEFTKWNEVQCGICQQTHDVEDLGGLPKSKLLNTSQAPADTEPEFCDVCRESPSKAASFCVDCGKKLCQQHMKIHDDARRVLSDKDHKIISIDVFTADPNSYRSVKCTEHKEYQSQLACSVCYKTFCTECETSFPCDVNFSPGGHPTDRSNGPHTMHFLSKLADQLRNSLTDQLKTLSDKVTGLCKDEKEAWRLLSDVEDKAKTMKETVNGLSNKKIAAIKEESEQLKTEIQDYQDECTNKVEVFVSELMARKDDMESLWKSTRQWMKNSHDSALIGEFKDINTKIRDAQVGVVEPCTLKVKTLMSPASLEMKEAEYFSQRLTNIPREGEFRDELIIAEKIYSVKIAKDGQILCGTSRGSQIRDIETMKLVTTIANINTQCHDLIQPIEIKLGVRRDESEYTNFVQIFVVDSTSSHEKTLFPVNQTAGKICRISQFGTDIYFFDQENKKLIVHSLLIDDVKEFPLEDASPFAICILPDSSLLIGYLRGKLTKYIFSKMMGLKKVWTLPVKACGIAYDPKSGMIFTASAKDGIVVISTEGVLLRKLKRDKPVGIKNVIDIAISGDQIILGCKDEGLKRFTIKY